MFQHGADFREGGAHLERARQIPVLELLLDAAKLALHRSAVRTFQRVRKP